MAADPSYDDAAASVAFRPSVQVGHTCPAAVHQEISAVVHLQILRHLASHPETASVSTSVCERAVLRDAAVAQALNSRRELSRRRYHASDDHVRNWVVAVVRTLNQRQVLDQIHHLLGDAVPDSIAVGHCRLHRLAVAGDQEVEAVMMVQSWARKDLPGASRSVAEPIVQHWPMHYRHPFLDCQLRHQVLEVPETVRPSAVVLPPADQILVVGKDLVDAVLQHLNSAETVWYVVDRDGSQ